MSTNPYWLREGASRRAAQAMNHRAAWAAGDKAQRLTLTGFPHEMGSAAAHGRLVHGTGR